MSDDEATTAYNANEGITLPGEQNATNNTGFSPLFITRSSHIYPWSQNTSFRGQDGHYWSNSFRSGWSSYFLRTRDAVYPNYTDSGAISLSHRCLVSTNNR